MTDIDWREPPPVKPGRKPWMIPDDVQAELKANPGRSARIATCREKKFAERLRERHPGFEITNRAAEKCTDPRIRKAYDVYAKWVG